MTHSNVAPDIQPIQALMSYHEAERNVLHCSSFQRMEVLLNHYPGTTYRRRKLTSRDWVVLLGQWWSGCDRIGVHAAELAEILPHAPVRLMMTAEENEAYDQLPIMVRIYRGAHPSLPLSTCWSLSKEVALGFPGKSRSGTDNAVLYTAYVRKSRIVALKLERGEQEVITFDAQGVRCETLG